MAIEPSLTLNQIGIDLGLSANGERLVRRALNMSMDREALRNAILGKGRARDRPRIMVPPTQELEISPEYAK